MKWILRVLGAVAGAFVLGTITAFISWPFWGWFEAKTGIESLGHSGPDEWVFYFCTGVWLVILLLLALRPLIWPRKTKSAAEAAPQ